MVSLFTLPFTLLFTPPFLPHSLLHLFPICSPFVPIRPSIWYPHPRIYVVVFVIISTASYRYTSNEVKSKSHFRNNQNQHHYYRLDLPSCRLQLSYRSSQLTTVSILPMLTLEGGLHTFIHLSNFCYETVINPSNTASQSNLAIQPCNPALQYLYTTINHIVLQNENYF